MPFSFLCHKEWQNEIYNDSKHKFIKQIYLLCRVHKYIYIVMQVITVIVKYFNVNPGGLLPFVYLYSSTCPKLECKSVL